MIKAQAVKGKRSGLVTALSAVGLVFGLLALVTSSIPLLGVGVFGQSLRRFYIPPATFGYILSAVNILTYCLGFSAILLCLTAFIAAYAKRVSKTLPVCSLCVGLFAVGLPLLTDAWYGPTLDLFSAQAGKTRYVKRYRESRVKKYSIRTPLMEAAEVGQTERVRELLREGVDPKVKSEGWSACGLAVRAGHIETVRTLLEEAPQLAEDKEYLNGLVMVAAQWGRTEIMQFLFQKGAPATARNPTQGNWTALMEATKRGHTDTVLLLLDAGADMDATNIRGWTALMEASLKGHDEIGMVLLERGADVNLKSQRGRTALLWASSTGSPEIVEALLANNADVNVKDNEGQTAIKFAARQGHTDIVRLLAAAGGRQ